MKSRFDNLFQAKPETEAIEPKPKKPKAIKSPKASKPKPPAGKMPEETQTREIVVLRRVGKRSKADFTQISAYIPKEAHKRAKAELLDDGRDFSELISDLLDDWLKTR